MISKMIDKYYKQHNSNGMVEIKVTPRAIWVELCNKKLTRVEYIQLQKLHDSQIQECYFRGAKLVRFEPTVNTGPQPAGQAQ